MSSSARPAFYVETKAIRRTAVREHLFEILDRLQARDAGGPARRDPKGHPAEHRRGAPRVAACQRMRVVLDTNVLVSAALIAEGQEARILRAWRAGAFDLVTCALLMNGTVECWRDNF